MVKFISWKDRKEKTKRSDADRHLLFSVHNYRLIVLLFLFSLFNYVYLKHGVYDWNTANRGSLCLALWEDGSVKIDKYHQFSGDICIRDGHYYCDKAPGVSFLALPFVGAAYTVLQTTGRTNNLTAFDPNIPPDKHQEPNINFKFLLVAGSLVVSLAGAIAVAVMYQLMLMLGTAQRIAVLIALLFGFGTPFGIWATVMFGHAPAASFLLFGTALGFFLLQPHDGIFTRSFEKNLLWIITGLLLAYTVWIEYTAAIPVCLIGLMFLAMMKERGYSFDQISFETLMMFCGAAPVACCFFVYNIIAFGTPFQLGYQFDATNFPQMDEGFYGIQFPNLYILWLTIFDSQHGILWFSPILFFSPFCAVYNVLQNRYRFLNFTCILIPLYYFLMNSSYAYWEIRHVTASLPFLVIPIGLVWASLGKITKLIAEILIFISFIVCFLALNVPASTTLSQSKFKVLFLTDEFLAGRIRNLSYYCGMNAYLSLGILLSIWLIAGFFLWKQLVVKKK